MEEKYWISMRLKPKTVVSFLTSVLALASSHHVVAQQHAGPDQIIEEVISIGTRVPGRTAEDLPVPVDVLSADDLSKTGQTEVGRMLQSLAPSFNFSSSSISDGTDALRPATLRGLGPDQTLVLVNGKRRHQASLIHINTSVGRGTAGVDMNAIPAASIKRIDILRDGAAAQYGSDAIAGIINIILNDSDEEGKINVSYGEYSEGDGETTNVDVTKGFAIGDIGFVNATFNFRDRGRTNRAGIQGACAYTLTDEGPDPCMDSDDNDALEIVDPREKTFPRDTFRIGDAESEQMAFTLNTALALGDGELYGFITYSDRESQSGAFYRNPVSGSGAYLDDGDNVVSLGFLPLINSQIDDLSFNIGYSIELDSGVGLDFSYTNGRNKIDYKTSNTINYSYVNFLNFGEGMSDASIRSEIPRSADAYGLELGLQTINIDARQSFGDFALAVGFEFRNDEYKIKPGDEYAYRDYDTDPVTSADLYTQNASGGSQGFPGIGPASAVDEDRDVMSFYLDGEYEFTADFLLGAALRYDDYDGFGDTINFKLAGNWAINEIWRLRSAVSTGFRAPSMQQLYFNNVSTQFVEDPNNPGGAQIPVQVGTFRNDSEVAAQIGIPQLKEEESFNLSFGIILTPIDPLVITVDFYSIDIDDRIVLSNQLDASDDPSGSLANALARAGAGSAQFFLNGADTETDGVDIIATYSGIELGAGALDITLAANKTETDVTEIFTSKAGSLSQIPADRVFSEQAISIIEEWQPEDRISLSGFYQVGDWRVNLAFNRYGEYTVLDGVRQTYGAKVLTDLSIKYDFGNGLILNFGGNNIFDEYPDKNKQGNSRNGTLEDGAGGDLIVSSPGVFTYSRRSAPFGFNGAYWYGGISYEF
jgi:iron complex outermembrane recepter protein